MEKEFILGILNSDIVADDLETLIVSGVVQEKNLKEYKEIAAIFFRNLPDKNLKAIDIANIFINAVMDYNSTYTMLNKSGNLVEKKQIATFLKSLIYSFNTIYIGRMNPLDMLAELEARTEEQDIFGTRS